MAFRVTPCGVDELSRLASAGVTHVLSILDPGAPRPKPLAAFGPHYRSELRFSDVIVPEPGAILPSAAHIAQLLSISREAMTLGSAAHLLIHCHGGVSRSTAAAVLCLVQAKPSRPASEALGEIVRARPGAWPNLRVLELGDEALGRRGELVATAGAFYRRVLDANPHLGKHLRGHGREREVALADRWR